MLPHLESFLRRLDLSIERRSYCNRSGAFGTPFGKSLRYVNWRFSTKSVLKLKEGILNKPIFIYQKFLFHVSRKYPNHLIAGPLFCTLCRMEEIGNLKACHDRRVQFFIIETFSLFYFNQISKVNFFLMVPQRFANLTL